MDDHRSGSDAITLGTICGIVGNVEAAVSFGEQESKAIHGRSPFNWFAVVTFCDKNGAMGGAPQKKSSLKKEQKEQKK